MKPWIQTPARKAAQMRNWKLYRLASTLAFLRAILYNNPTLRQEALRLLNRVKDQIDRDWKNATRKRN